MLFKLHLHVKKNKCTFFFFFFAAILQKYLDNFDLSIKVIYILGTLGFSIGNLHKT